MAEEFEPIPDNFMNVIFGQVYKKLTNGGDPKMLGANNFVAWEPVATVLDKEAFDYAAKGVFGVVPKAENMSDEEYNNLRASKKWGSFAHAEETARIIDQLPSDIPKVEDGSRAFTIFNPSGGAVSKVYSEVMDYSVVKDSKIDPKIEKKLEKLRGTLFKTKKLKNPDFDPETVEHPEDNPEFIFQSFPSPKYVKYLEYEVKYYEAEDELTSLQKRVSDGDAEAMTEMSINGRSFIAKRDSALKRWEALGFKGAIEKVMNYIDEIESSNFLTIKKKCESELLASKRTGLGGSNEYYYSTPIPSTILQNSDGWQKFEFKKKEFDAESKKTSHKWEAKASYFGIGKASTGGERTSVNSEMNINDFQMSFKMTKCYVSRPWCSVTYLKSRYWKFSKHGKEALNNQMVSDGNGGGLMPAFTTELYFVTDLKIGFKKDSASYKKVKTHIKAGGGFRIGAFNMGGKYEYNNEKVSNSRKTEEQNEEASGILLIGRKCHVFEDICPNPLPSIADDEWIEVN